MPFEGPLAITGAAGKIGTVLRRGLGDLGPIRSLDVKPIQDPLDGERVVEADVRDLDALLEAFDGVHGVIHLAGIPTEAPFEDVLDVNIRGAHHVFEAARRAGVRRVVFASSAHTTGFYPWEAVVGPDDPVRPDTFYGASKVAGEALGRLYADKFGLEVVAIRIVGFAPEPRDPGYLWGWLSPRDCLQLFRRSLEADGLSYLCVYGRSANTRARWRTDGWDLLGYAPEDDAEGFSERFDLSEPPYPLQGMRFPEITSEDIDGSKGLGSGKVP
jgi:uronate dehydrogenase